MAAPTCAFDIVLVLDESGSMTSPIPGDNHGLKKYQIVDQILTQFVQKLPPNARMGVVDFDTQGEMLIGLSDRATLLQELPRLVKETKHQGLTSVLAGVRVAEQMLSTQGRGSTPTQNTVPGFIVAVTDGVVTFNINGPEAKVDFLIQLGNYKDNSKIKYKYKTANAADTIKIIDSILELVCPPEPQEVQVTFIEEIIPPVPFEGLKEGDIVLDGVKIGVGQAVKPLIAGTKHRVEFKKPSHPDYTFSNGSPPYVDFTVPDTDTTIKSIFVPTQVPRSYLTIRTFYDPEIVNKDIKGDIYLDGQKPLNVVVPEDPDSTKYLVGSGETVKMRLVPGTYTISFSDISVPKMKYTTPAPFVVTLKQSEDRVEDRTYVGERIPDIFWLKPIEYTKKIRSVFTKGMFSNNVPNLTRFYKTSTDVYLNNYYTHVYNEVSGSVTGSIQFSLAYGHKYGSGSNDEGGQYNDTPTRAIYGQYRNIIIGNPTASFNLTGTETDHFYLVSYQKDRRDTQADFGAMEINIAHLSGSEYIAGNEMNTHTGSNVELSGTGAVLRLVSDYTINTYPSRSNALIEYNIVSGSIEDGVYNKSNPHRYGKLYPSLGVVLIDANKLDASASFGTVTTRELDAKNQDKFFTAISGAALLTDASGDYLGMKARAYKEEINEYVFIHAGNKEFNMSNNPSYFDQASGEINSDFYRNEKAYISTIGLYDVNRELIAVAKVSQPELKSFTDEVVFNVKLKY